MYNEANLANLTIFNNRIAHQILNASTMKTHTLASILCIFLFLPCLNATPDITPAPQQITTRKGMCTHSACRPFLKVTRDLSVPAEGFILDLGPHRAKVRASDAAGVYYALVTLAQMAGADCHQASVPEEFLTKNSWSVERCRIEDSPRFPYRGLLLDSSRHFRSKQFIFNHLDAMAAMRLNRLHFHLTDAAGWRLQIDSFPRLTQFAAWRSKEFYRDWSFGHKREEKLYCNGPENGGFGGFYTKDDIREIVAYAAERHIVVVPEIEMPGHSEEVMAAYPELSCNGQPYSSGDLCAGKEATFEFLEKVLDEVMDLFPSEYIHIGGDEAGKSTWKTCPDCQRRMQEEGLKDVNELQGWFIKRIEKYVESRGRHIIGWDEILQGGLAPHATVMSWRGTDGGKAAVASGHNAIMTPGRWCYIDSAQDAPDYEPATFNNYLPISKIYDYDPEDGIYPEVKDGDAGESTEKSSSVGRILGVQANLWAEMVETDSLAEYMYWPRAIALAEIAWTRPEQKNYEDFRRRAVQITEKMKAAGYNAFDLANERGNRPEALEQIPHLALGCPVTYNCRYDKRGYPAAGEATLTDGLGGSWTYNDGRWQGFLSDIDATVDLGEEKTVHTVTVTFQHNKMLGVFFPETVQVEFPDDSGSTGANAGAALQSEGTNIGSNNKVQTVLTAGPEIDPDSLGAHFRTYTLTIPDGVATRFVRLKAPRTSRGGYMFLDEIIVR